MAVANAMTSARPKASIRGPLGGPVRSPLCAQRDTQPSSWCSSTVVARRPATNTGTHTAELWNTAGTLLASATFTNESSSGWQTVNFATSVAISANTTYIVSYHTTSSYISYTAGAFSSSGVDNGSLHALANGVDGGNSVYKYGGASFTTQYNGQAASYWVSPVFQAS